LLVAAIVLLAAGAVVEALRPHSRAPRPAVYAPPQLDCRSIDRRLLLVGRRTSDYLVLPCGR
jgi:hypothetical protein